MNGSIQLIQEFRSLKKVDGITAVICPPACYLPLFANTSIKFGAQNCHFANGGAFTGELSAVQLKEFGCTYVILGHSERRAQFYETDSMINHKAAQAIAHGLSASVKPMKSATKVDLNKCCYLNLIRPHID